MTADELHKLRLLAKGAGQVQGSQQLLVLEDLLVTGRWLADRALLDAVAAEGMSEVGRRLGISRQAVQQRVSVARRRKMWRFLGPDAPPGQHGDQTTP